MYACRTALVFCMCCILAAAPPVYSQGDPPQPKKPLTVEDLYHFDHPQTPALSPDGKRLAYVRRWIDAKAKRERQSLWLVDGQREKARPLEQGEADARAPLSSPDGTWIVFLSTRPRSDGSKPTPPVPPESDPATDIWLIPADGGAAIPLAGPDRPYGRVFNDGFYGQLAFSPDGRRLVFIADDGKDPRTPEEIEVDVVVVRPDQGEATPATAPRRDGHPRWLHGRPSSAKR
jgi:Tol biopolymer transport system component